MADKKISDMSAATKLYHDDLITLVHDSANYKMMGTYAHLTSRWLTLDASVYTAAPAARYYDGSAFQAVADWAADTVITVGEYRKPTAANGYIYECTARSGDFKTHAATEPTWPLVLGDIVVDDAVTWMCRGYHSIATASDLGDLIKVGYPLSYYYNSTWYYGLVAAITSSYICVAGAPLTSSYALGELRVGHPEMVRTRELFMDGDYDAGSDCVHEPRVRWEGGDAYLVSFALRHETADTGADDPYVNIELDGNVVSTSGDGTDEDAGFQPGTSWVANEFTAIKAANYKIERGEEINATVTNAGSNGDADTLSASLAFVME